MSSQFDNYDPFAIFKSQLFQAELHAFSAGQTHDFSWLIDSFVDKAASRIVTRHVASLLHDRQSKKLVIDALKYLEAQGQSPTDVTHVTFDMITLLLNYFHTFVSYQRVVFPVGYWAKGAFKWLKKPKQGYGLFDHMVDGLMTEPFEAIPKLIEPSVLALLGNARQKLHLLTEADFRELAKHYVVQKYDDLYNLTLLYGLHPIGNRIGDLLAKEEQTQQYLTNKYPNQPAMRL